MTQNAAHPAIIADDDTPKLDCRGGVHSEDVVLVYTGRPEPRRMCGFHAQQQRANTVTN